MTLVERIYMNEECSDLIDRSNGELVPSGRRWRK